MKKKQFPGMKTLLLIVQLGLVTSLLLITTESKAQANWEVGFRFGEGVKFVKAD